MAAVALLWLWTSWSSSIFYWCSTIWQFSDRWWGHICSWRLFFRGSDESFLYHRYPSAATPMKDVCGPQGRLYWKITFGQIWPLHHSQHVLFSPSSYLGWRLTTKHNFILFTYGHQTGKCCTVLYVMHDVPICNITQLPHLVYRLRLLACQLPKLSLKYDSIHKSRSYHGRVFAYENSCVKNSTLHLMVYCLCSSMHKDYGGISVFAPSSVINFTMYFHEEWSQQKHIA